MPFTKTFVLLFRNLFLAASVLAVAGGATALAQSPSELLQSYVGDWRGSGELKGTDEAETFSCRLDVTRGRQTKVNYAGRCSLVGMNLSVRGTIAYVESAGRYEAAMSSNARFDGIAVGQRRGNSIVFDLRERGESDEGEDVTIGSRITLADDRISVDFEVTFNDTGDRMSAAVPFSRQ